MSMDAPAKRSVRILIVEDSRTQAEYLRHILEQEGYRVILADNGRDALEQIAAGRPTLVLSDIVMPEMNGYELCRQIKQNPATATIPVILVTQLFDPVDVITGLESGADDFIIKPFDPASIGERIGSILSSLGRPDPDGALPDLVVSLFDKTRTIAASRLRILSILLSTYDVAVRKNAELEEARERLNAVNEQLGKAVDDLRKSNSSLEQENTERRRVEKALDEANRKLNLMASITRHDVLNQLTTQQEYLEGAIASRETDPARAWDQVVRARVIAGQTINAVRFTGDYQKIGVKSPSWHDLHAVIAAAAQATDTGTIRVENQVYGDIQIYADPMLGKVFSNLIENAVRYGGTVSRVRFTFALQGDGALITCEDDGRGIPAADKDRIFTYEYGMNAGLGLFLSREILALTGITIRETGTSPGGARFEFICPSGTFRRP